MSEDRRNDLGGKIIAGALVGIIGLFIALFVNSSWITANEGKNIGIVNTKEISTLQAQFISIQADLTEIKELLRRKVPN